MRDSLIADLLGGAMTRGTFAIAIVLMMLFHSKAAAQWAQTNGPYGASVAALVASPDGAQIFAGTGHGGVFRSTDRGKIWTAVNSGLAPIDKILSLAFDGTNLFAGTYTAVFRSTNNGTSWAAVNSGFLINTAILCFAFKSDGIGGTYVFAGANYNGVYRSTNNGAEWSAVNSGLPIDGGGGHYSVHSLVVCGANLLAATESGVFLSTNNGSSWAGVTNGLPAYSAITDLAVNGANVLVATWSGVFLSTNNGTSWTAVNSGLPAHPGVSALAVNGENLFAATGSGVFLSTNVGTRWSASANTGLPLSTDAGSLSNVIRPLVTSGMDLFVGCLATNGWEHAGMGVFRSTDRGESWTPANTGMNQSMVAAFAVSPDRAGETNLFAGTEGGGVFLSNNDGVDWTDISSGLADRIVQCLAVKSESVGSDLFAGTRSGVFRSNDKGTTWSSVSTGLPPGTAIWSIAVNGTSLFAGTGGGGIFLSTNSGANWSAAKTGLPMVAWVYSLAVIDGNLFASVATDGVDWAGVYHSSNNGATWVAAESGLPTRFIVTCFLGFPNAIRGTNVFAATLGKGVFLSTDNGSSWRPVNNPPSAVNGDVFREVLSMATDGTNLFAGTSAGVFLSADKGASWISVDSGLRETGGEGQSLAASGAYLFAGTNGHGVWRRPLSEMITGVAGQHDDTPSSFVLEQNFPNPFNPSTTIRFVLPQRSHVILSVFNILGQQVQTLFQGEKESGLHEVRFDASDLSSGVYLYTLRAGEIVESKRLFLLR